MDLYSKTFMGGVQTFMYARLIHAITMTRMNLIYMLCVVEHIVDVRDVNQH